MIASTINSTNLPMYILPEKLSIERAGIVFVHPVLKPILTKQDLIEHFQVSDLRALRRCVLTDKVLQQCGISLAEYRCKSIFTVAQSVRLYDVLGITWLRTNQRI